MPYLLVMRWQATLVIIASLSAGLTASKLLLMSGLTNVAIRYPVAALIAYVGVTVMAMLWITQIRPAARSHP